MKAIATVSMYDMGAANRNGLRRSTTLEQRKQAIAEAAQQRYVEFTGGQTQLMMTGCKQIAQVSDAQYGALVQAQSSTPAAPTPKVPSNAG